MIAGALTHDGDEARIGEHIAACIAEFERTTVAIDVHFLQFFRVTCIMRMRAEWNVKRSCGNRS